MIPDFVMLNFIAICKGINAPSGTSVELPKIFFWKRMVGVGLVRNSLFTLITYLMKPLFPATTREFMSRRNHYGVDFSFVTC